jgi:hypothetical protein
MNSYHKLLTTLCFNLLLSVPCYAEVIEPKDIKFPIVTEKLMKGDIFFKMKVISPRRLSETYAEFADLDSMAFSQEANIQIVLTKSAYVVSKPAGFFDHHNMNDQNYLTHLLGEQTVNKKSDNLYQISVPQDHQYQLRTYFDSDDISTLPNSKVIQAVSRARKLDVISQSSTSTTFWEMNKFTKYSVGSIRVSSFVPMKENKTLVLSYTLSGILKPFARPEVLKKNLIKEIEAQRNLLESYEVK